MSTTAAIPSVTPIPPVAPRDPRNDVKPDFAKARYTEQVQSLMAAAVEPDGTITRPARTHAEAVKVLDDVWEDEHLEAMTEWEDYGLLYEQYKKEVEDRAKAKAEEADAELDKKRPKMPTFIQGLLVKSTVAVIPSKFARDRLKGHQFCEVWYWTPEGIADARLSGTATTSGADAEGGVDIGNGVVIKSGGNQPSKRAVPDAKLDMAALSAGWALWIRGMLDEKYDADHVKAWVDLKHHLENDAHWRHTPLGDAIVIRYFAEIRYEWYQWINGTGPAFDVAIVNDDRMCRIADELMRERLFATEVRAYCVPRIMRSADRSFYFICFASSATLHFASLAYCMMRRFVALLQYQYVLCRLLCFPLHHFACFCFACLSSEGASNDLQVGTGFRSRPHP